MSCHVLVSQTQDTIGFNNIEFPAPIALNILQVGSNGSPGLPGRDLELQVSTTHVQYRLVGSLTWIDLIPLVDLQGMDGVAGTSGADGRELELNVSATHIQWRYVGDLVYTNLIALSLLQGADGTPGVAGTAGKQIELQTNSTHVQWRYVGDVSWINLILLSAITGANGINGTNGADGEEIQLQVSATHIQWKYLSDVSWTNLIPLASLVGATGVAGPNGKEIELRVNSSMLQWKYTVDSTWIDLITISGSSAAWGGITGTLSAQTDLQNALDAKTTLAAIKEDLRTNGLTLDGAGAVTAPSSGNYIFRSTRAANQETPVWLDSNNRLNLIQRSIYDVNIFQWLPNSASSLSIAYGATWSAQNSGTGSGQIANFKAAGSYISQLTANLFQTGTATAGASGTASSSLAGMWRGNAAGYGGFFHFMRFGVETFASDMKLLLGISAVATTPLTVEPSAYGNNTIGLIKDSTDTNWQFLVKGTSAAVKSDTGITVAAGNGLDLYMYCPPNGSTIYYHIVDPQTKTVLVNNASADISGVTATAFMTSRALIGSTSGTTTKNLALAKIYGENY